LRNVLVAINAETKMMPTLRALRGLLELRADSFRWMPNRIVPTLTDLLEEQAVLAFNKDHFRWALSRPGCVSL